MTSQSLKTDLENFDGADDPLVWYEGATTTAPQYLYADHQGSVVAVANGSGVVTGINGYDEYGIPNPTNTGRFQYTGQAWLPELGMYHYKARIYSPTLGRFLQTDPIGYEDQINLYAYVGNDPMNATDPTGKEAWLVSRPTGYGDTVHMFVVISPTPGGEVQAQFSYGPSRGTGGQLTSQRQNSSIYKTTERHRQTTRQLLRKACPQEPQRQVGGMLIASCLGQVPQ